MDYSEAAKALSKGYSIPNIEARDHLLKLQQDEDYQKQIRMGDIEFEMDMYDDIMYGKPAIEKSDQLDRLNELDSILGTQTGDVDDLGIAALRNWSMNTDPLKYTDPTPYDLNVYDQEGTFVGVSPEGLDRYLGGNFGDKIDINMNEIMRQKSSIDDDPYELGNKISDVYRHEFKHSILNNKEDYSHPTIYGTGARFGLSNAISRDENRMFKDPRLYQQNPFNTSQYEGRPHREAYSEDRAGDYARENINKLNQINFRREPSVGQRGGPPTERFSTGGLASLIPGGRR
jgi:hypothetical protein|tara:strand:+ start:44 stop:907 length:864 start_codon:yes stop_codon:yes gene_type:complete